MKTITLTQPYASLVAIGAKKIETRSWSTSFRGPLAIHAAKGLGPVGGKVGFTELCVSSPFWEALTGAGYCGPWGRQPPRGAIVAVCELAECIPIEEGLLSFQSPGVDWWIITEQERAFGDYTPGRYAWLLSNVRALPEPIPAKGALGLWNYEGEL